MERYESEAMNFILDYEIEHGNEIKWITKGMWSVDSITMKKPLRLIDDHETRAKLIDSIKFWENSDPHYGVGAGFYCEETHEYIIGPFRVQTIGGRTYLFNG